MRRLGPSARLAERPDVQRIVPLAAPFLHPLGEALPPKHLALRAGGWKSRCCRGEAEWKGGGRCCTDGLEGGSARNLSDSVGDLADPVAVKGGGS
ncbi:hypothetical protein SKAU_G00292570 [Synaphobranchus kaupii]|uniref:Uncharacterized protein n=1 Tax=Synaphobranchus kaupii TaxID=118154 RepID=A0A9Q1EU66_SYNKA|nr:hypothetical protein SKAU_G00292570 [Synaphobranchus kaupii]